MHDFDIALAGACLPQPGLERARGGFVRQRNHSRLPAHSLLKGEFGIVAGGERRDPKAVGIALDHAQSAATDRAGRTQNGDALHAVLSYCKGGQVRSARPEKIVDNDNRDHCRVGVVWVGRPE